MQYDENAIREMIGEVRQQLKTLNRINKQNHITELLNPSDRMDRVALLNAIKLNRDALATLRDRGALIDHKLISTLDSILEALVIVHATAKVKEVVSAAELSEAIESVSKVLNSLTRKTPFTVRETITCEADVFNFTVARKFSLGRRAKNIKVSLKSMKKALAPT